MAKDHLKKKVAKLINRNRYSKFIAFGWMEHPTEGA